MKRGCSCGALCFGLIRKRCLHSDGVRRYGLSRFRFSLRKRCNVLQREPSRCGIPDNIPFPRNDPRVPDPADHHIFLHLIIRKIPDYKIIDIGRVILVAANPQPLNNLWKSRRQNELALLHSLIEQLPDPLDRARIQNLFHCGGRAGCRLLNTQILALLKNPFQRFQFKHSVADDDIVALALRKYPEENERIIVVDHDLILARPAADPRLPRHIEHQISIRVRHDPYPFRQNLLHLRGFDIDRIVQILPHFAVIILKISVRNIAGIPPHEQNSRAIVRQILHTFGSRDQFPDRPFSQDPFLLYAFAVRVLQICHLLTSSLWCLAPLNFYKLYKLPVYGAWHH